MAGAVEIAGCAQLGAAQSGVAALGQLTVAQPVATGEREIDADLRGPTPFSEPHILRSTPDRCGVPAEETV